ncbi:hypothetical protein COY52_13010 [Candidatus Desantisbacteria bacterium CG_4_10_14_0_8_um_filter_48_22]|uniref:Uncharacterized protein n=1 Tax=Candidatus Desantisbacteria bacterium CG_4_10_14_0_8_um_filter_48_22 TaxID=1974543 RepID=A0A2M7S4T8_9BACT|nr:MAG: hypothetical protein COS16_09195 [Candidatus Desantisbacteria bacterium CG02_land_8_20_14_3_00_49_13]PIZ14263.1 MAG: hypothetical protein COY52_13010 [Candidatus Desantisbacteria bacterium CG_4_10_14_0_8_um_filter_48_22]
MTPTGNSFFSLFACYYLLSLQHVPLPLLLLKKAVYGDMMIQAQTEVLAGDLLIMMIQVGTQVLRSWVMGMEMSLLQFPTGVIQITNIPVTISDRSST